MRTLRVSYRRTRDFGRRMGSTPTMGTSCHSVLRAYASHNIYNDLDIVNCHFAILTSLCKELELTESTTRCAIKSTRRSSRRC